MPLIVKGAGRVEPGSVSDRLVSGEDFLPSLVDLTGETLPRSYGGSGKSLWREGDEERRLYLHFPDYHEGPPCAAVRDKRYKLIWFFEEDTCELYDLQEDPAERLDLAGHLPERVALMKGDLKAWIERQSSGWPRPNPKYSPDRASDWGGAGLKDCPMFSNLGGVDTAEENGLSGACFIVQGILEEIVLYDK